MEETASNSGLIPEIIEKINNATNILIALSSDPSVDEMCAAIGLSLFLDRLGKRATAIYSGSTPNALEFLKPEETFESTVDALQDFVIALSKEKADHLRYKLDGDFVKIYITPYKSKINEKDLNYSYGDFNVDLVIALDVANGVDLDSALREHGRIMHDAVIVNITTGNPGKLGEIEWSDKEASSISEMAAELIYSMNDAKLDKEEATAFLTGIVASTDKFSNAKTTPECMRISSRLMESGADQQLVSKNITSDVENRIFKKAPNEEPEEKLEEKIEEKPEEKIEENDPAKLEIRHDEKDEELKVMESDDDKVTEELKVENESTIKPEEVAESNFGAEPEAKLEAEPEPEPEPEPEDLLGDLKAAEASLSHAGAETTPESIKEPLKINSADSGIIEEKQEKILQPESTDFSGPLETPIEGNKYGQMLEDALSSINAAPEPQVAMQTTQDFTQNTSAAMQNEPITAQGVSFSDNPAAMTAPSVPTTPEINGVPQMNYMPLPGEEVLPPPPAPPIDMSVAPQPDMAIQADMSQALPSVEPITPAAPVSEPTPTSLGPQPAMQDQVYNAQAVDPGAFKIPGM